MTFEVGDIIEFTATRVDGKERELGLVLKRMSDEISLQPLCCREGIPKAGILLK